MKQLILTAAFLIAAIVGFSQKPEIFSPSGIAINGYDVVAFYTESQMVKGTDQFSVEWKSAKWVFSSQQNLDRFKSAPEKYEPAYGGYCAFGLSRGYKASTQADTWAIIHNKLYFNYNLKVKELWVRNQATYIDTANAKWKAIKNL